MHNIAKTTKKKRSKRLRNMSTVSFLFLREKVLPLVKYMNLACHCQLVRQK